MNLHKIATILTKHFSFFLVCAVIIGIFTPPLASLLNPIIMYLLMGVIFCGFLKLDINSTKHEIKNWHYSLALLIYSMILQPALFYYLACIFIDTSHFNSDWPKGILLLYICPTAAIAPTLAFLLKGRFERTLLNLTLTTIVAPFTVPYMLYYIAGTSIQLDPIKMMLFMIQLIIVPMILAMLLNKWSPNTKKKILPSIPSLSVFLLIIIVIGATHNFLKSLNGNYILMAEGIFIGLFFMLLSFASSWFVTIKGQKEDRMTTSIVTTWTNIGLAIVLAQKFFAVEAPLVLTFVIISEISWNTTFVPAQWFSKWVYKKTEQTTIS